MATNKPKNRVKAEKQRLLSLFAGIDENKREVVLPLIDRAAFLRVALEDLESEMLVEGFTEDYNNGQHQSGKKKSAAAQSHDAFTKNLNAITKTLIDLVPAAQKAGAIEELAAKFA